MSSPRHNPRGSVVGHSSHHHHSSQQQQHHSVRSYNELSESKDVVFGLGLATLPQSQQNQRQQQHHHHAKSSASGTGASQVGGSSGVSGSHVGGVRSGGHFGQNPANVYFQHDAGFINQETHTRQQRRAQNAQAAGFDSKKQGLGIFGEALTVIQSSDDAITFEPFLEYFVKLSFTALRMFSGVCAGFSLLLLVYLFNASSPLNEPVVRSTLTGEIVGNVTIQGGYNQLCSNETVAGSGNDCYFLLRYAGLYKGLSYFYQIITLLLCFLALLPFAFDLAMARAKLVSSLGKAKRKAGEDNQPEKKPEEADEDDSNDEDLEVDDDDDETERAIKQRRLDQRRAARNKKERAREKARTPTGKALLVVRHVVTGRFPIFFLCLVCNIFIATVEVDRRTVAKMVALQSRETDRLRWAIIIRSVLFMLAWLASFSKPK